MKPLTGEAMQISYTTIGAMIAVILIATLGLIAMKRRGKT
ncbi:LPXTG cell wall anchor domain-containing protein [Candidatus Bathyarchaeota archaeon]|nr:LPXTG cell wall anchor domain-containing protein [Candidatus Bathyarchaeota archaeon]